MIGRGSAYLHMTEPRKMFSSHLSALNAGQRRVMWFNMREEPVIYINGNPYVVREANKPFANLEYTGILLCLAEQMPQQ